MNWTTEDWKSVLFSDESSLYTFRSCPKIVRRLLGSDKMEPKFTIKTKKHPPSVMVWGCFCNFGRGSLNLLRKNTTMNAERYSAMLMEKKSADNEFAQDKNFNSRWSSLSQDESQ